MHRIYNEVMLLGGVFVKTKNRKLILSLLVILVGLFSVMYFNIKYSVLETNEKISNISKKDGKKIVLIDPGHGGIDGGAVSSRGTIEKDINLSISLILRDYLQEEGFTVVLTRSDDVGLYTDGGSVRKKKNEDLNNRCRMISESNCDLFISIHQNKFPESKYYGAQVWYSNNKESEKIAHLIQQNMIVDVDSSNSRKEKPALDQFKILRCNLSVPSVIVECGFLSNAEEEQKLKNVEYQKKIAKSLTKSIKMYLNEK